VWSCRWLPTFWRSVSPPSSGQKWTYSVFLKHWLPPTGLHGGPTQKVANHIKYFMLCTFCSTVNCFIVKYSCICILGTAGNIAVGYLFSVNACYCD
jgi:hypothetical protein